MLNGPKRSEANEIPNTHLITLQSLQVRWSWVKSRHSTLSISCRGTWEVWRKIHELEEEVEIKVTYISTWQTNLLSDICLIKDIFAPSALDHSKKNILQRSLTVSVKSARTKTTTIKRTKASERKTHVYNVVFELDVKAVARQGNDNLLRLLHILHTFTMQHWERDLHMQTSSTQPHPSIKTESS